MTEFMSENCFDWFNLTSHPDHVIFMEIFYYSFLFNKNIENNYGYSFVSTLQAFLTLNNITEDQLKANVPAVFGRANFLEDARVHVRPQIPKFTSWLASFVRHYSLRTFKPDDDPFVWQFLKESGTVQMAVSDESIGLYNRAMSGFFNDGTYTPPYRRGRSGERYA
eukprot:CAMPEP_0196667508 /NCGR_PEP_ID=MMETSP1086-20130531/65122_1 /TAXON_ID=77921 /ORGANISM="Cyanoptyche  gloeocystis , Strain SAG4.97" /LENGTH=165 /DNA_ID=CAMNT_0042004845 /DNA_START=26 /DNA_END=523 /DNA_ORIENTATION=-